MGRRSYDQSCALARALDVIGDRWAPLVIRELSLGPRRYSDLARGLPGIATDMLTRRLRELEQAGVVRRREIGSPAPATVYELTERGLALEEPLLGLARWGLELMTPPSGTSAFTPAIMANGLRVILRPHGQRKRLEVGLRSRGEDFRLEVEGGCVRVTRGAAEAPDLSLSGEPWPLMALITGELEPGEALIGEPDGSEVELSGDRRALERLRAMVDLPEAVRTAAPPGIPA